MNHTVRLFARARDLAGASAVVVDLPSGARVADLRARLLGQHPALGPLLGRCAVAVNNEFDESAQDRLLAAYFGDAPDAGRRASLRLMMLVSDAREAAWGVVQASISELDFDFAGYARHHFSRLERNASDPRLEEWLRAATA